MNVLEIKNNLVKLAYNVKDNLSLSSFVIVEDVNTPYVAQVVNLKADATSNYAIVKLLFTFNKEGILKNYNGTIPSLKSTVTVLPSNELLDIIPLENPILIGNLAQQNTSLKVDKTILLNNLLICSNNTENSNILLNNIIKQIDNKVVVFDTDGQFDWDEKIVFSQNFKLPLNYDTINFIYEHDLDEVDETTKAIIQDIFIEVQEYTKTLPEGYLPFETFVDVVDKQYKETQITHLVLLKNKLLKYKELNVFAENLKDIINLSIAIDKSNVTVIDISDMTDALQKEIMSYSYKVMSNINETINAFVKINNSNTDKKLLKTFLERSNIYTTIVCPHEYKYISELKEVAQNLILFAPLNLQHDFAAYNTFINKLNQDEFVIYGAHTQNIPFIIELDELNLEKEEEIQEENLLENITVPMPGHAPTSNAKNQGITTEKSIAEQSEDVETASIDNNVQIVDETETTKDIQNIIIESIEDENVITEEPEENEIYNILDDNDEEIVTNEPEIDYSVENIDAEANFPEPQIIDNINDNDILIEQAAKDVDKLIYEKLPDEEISIDENMSVDELTEDDLNLIGDLTIENNALEESPNIEEEVPVVPIYDAEDIEQTQTFDSGDRVSTAKYGEGVVEKMIKYGNKTLCSIEFPNIGRRLLDPAMTEITKL